MPRVLVNVSDVLVVRLTKFKLEVVLEVEPGAVEEGVLGAAGEAWGGGQSEARNSESNPNER